MNRIVGIAILMASFSVGWLWMLFESAVDTPLIKDRPAYVDVKKGDSFGRITNMLVEKGILTKPLWFKFLAYKDGLSGRLKAGEYELPVGITARQILALIVSGRARQHAVTFVEGWNFKQIMDIISRQPALKHNLAGKTHAEVMAMIGAQESHPEGLFFPDTYFFTKGTKDVELLKRAYAKMQTVLGKAWSERADGLPLDSPYQALILASIVEKETGQDDERPIIAGVFIRRLRKGMLLQTDPTVIYGLGDSFDGDIRFADLHADTPYNTYVKPGLPPTPIAMPSAASVRAVLHPAEGSSLYFVGKGDGTHVFSTTLKDHNMAVDLFQRKKPAP
ncbi:MAG: endolytic transglycosylase MltG [Pseudomonadota bacterium]